MARPARPIVLQREAVLNTPMRAGMLLGASAAIYAVTLAGVSVMQADTDATTAAQRQPYLAAVAAARSANDALEAALAKADSGAQVLASQYATVGQDIAGYQARLDQLARLVAEVQGSAAALPTRISLPTVSVRSAGSLGQHGQQQGARHQDHDQGLGRLTPGRWGPTAGPVVIASPPPELRRGPATRRPGQGCRVLGARTRALPSRSTSGCPPWAWWGNPLGTTPRESRGPGAEGVRGGRSGSLCGSARTVRPTALNRLAGTGRLVAVSWRLRTMLAAVHRAGRLTAGRFDASVLADLERLGEHGATLDAAAGTGR